VKDFSVNIVIEVSDNIAENLAAFRHRVRKLEESCFMVSSAIGSQCSEALPYSASVLESSQR
jgi:hypothetical protein